MLYKVTFCTRETSGWLDTLPAELLFKVLVFCDVVAPDPDRPSRLQQAHAQGVFRQVSRACKRRVDEAIAPRPCSPLRAFFLGDNVALRFVTDPRVRRGAVARFTACGVKGAPPVLPLHLEFLCVQLGDVDPDQLHGVRVRSMSFVGSFRRNPLSQKWRACAVHVVEQLHLVPRDESLAFVRRPPHPFPVSPEGLQFVPLQVNLIGLGLDGVDLEPLRYVHTIILALSTGVTGSQVSKLTGVRTLSLGRGFTSLECVRELVHLRFFFFRDNPEITDVTPLLELRNLRYVDGTNTGVPLCAWSRLQAARPETFVSRG